MKNHSSVYKIAKSSIETNIISLDAGTFVSAGAHQFRSFWTRDFCLAVKGLLAIDRGDVVKSHLEYLINNRRSDDLVPLYVDSMNPLVRVVVGTILNAFGIKYSLPFKQSVAPYYLVNAKYEAIDSNILVLYAAHEYAERTKDYDWFKKYENDFRAIFKFYEKKMKNGLISQAEHADWQDSSKREGKTFLTNLIYYHMGQIYGFLSNEELLQRKTMIMDEFYDADSGLFKGIEGRSNISLEGILWAIEYDLLVDSDDLYKKLSLHPLFTQFSMPGYATYPSYTRDDTYIQVKIVGLQEYHGNLFWSWLIGYSAKIAYKKSDMQTFNKIYKQLEKMLERDQTVCEVYENGDDHKPVSKLLYKTESPFSWGAGYILDLENTINKS